MKIVHIIFSFITGGAETMLVDIVNEQVKQVDVDIVIVNNIYNKALIDKIDNNINVHLIERKPNSKNPIYLIRLNKLLLKIKPTVVHCHDHNIILLLLPQFKNIAVLTVHDVGIESDNFKYYKKLFSISNSVKTDLKIRTGFDSILVYNGIDFDKIQLKELSNVTDNFKIVVVSRLRHLKKGQHLVIEALNLLVKKGVFNIFVDFIGDEIIKGESLNYLNTLVQNYSLTSCITFLGHKDRDYVYSHIKDYDLLIQPSLFEGFGLTVAEGIAAKIPVLVSDVDGPMEVIDNGKYGFYFKSGNFEQLAQQIEFIYSNHDNIELKQKVDEAYNHVKNNFNIIKTANNYLNNY